MYEQKGRLLDNTRRHASGLPSHDVLLWGARGTGKSASVGAVVGLLQRNGIDMALMQCMADRLESLPDLFAMLRHTARPFILFIDDLVDAFLLAQQHIKKLSGNAFNIGGGPQNTISLLELLDLLTELHGGEISIEFSPCLLFTVLPSYRFRLWRG